MDRNEIGRSHQEGAALITSLLILLVMTIIGVTAMQRGNIEEKMAGNLRDRNLAFQAAETALRAGERCASTDCSAGYHLYVAGNASLSPLYSSLWASSNVAIYTGANLADLTSSPQYVVEQLFYLCTPDSVDVTAEVTRCYSKVTARALGGTTNAEVILQSGYKR